MYYQQVNPERTDGGDDAIARARAFGLEVAGTTGYLCALLWKLVLSCCGVYMVARVWGRSWREPRETTCKPSTLVPVGLRQGYGLAHGLGVPASAERVVEELDAGRG